MPYVRIVRGCSASTMSMGESRSAAIETVTTEKQACPCAVGRYHHAKPRNVTALRRPPVWQSLLTMLAWLEKAGLSGMNHFIAAIEGALRPALARYEAYEVTILASLNGRLDGIVRALEWPRPAMQLTAGDLSRVLGGTPRDWDSAAT